MNTLTIIIIVTAVVLSVCLVVCLVKGKGDRKRLRATNLVLPLLALLLFVGVFVGGGLSRRHIRKELTALQESVGVPGVVKGEDVTRLEELESRNVRLNRLIGRDKEIEERFASLHAMD